MSITSQSEKKYSKKKNNNNKKSKGLFWKDQGVWKELEI